MKHLKFLAAAGLAMATLSSSSFAATMAPLPGGLPYSTIINGTSLSGHSFTATVNEEVYAAASDPYAAFISAPAGDFVFAFVVNNNSIIPPGDFLKTFDVSSGDYVAAMGIADNGGVTSHVTSGVGTIHATYSFDGITTNAPNYSQVLLFAAAGPLALQDATLADGSTGPGLVISDAGTPGGPGVPLPAPASVWGGLSLVGLLVGSRFRKGRVQA